LKFNIGFDLR